MPARPRKIKVSKPSKRCNKHRSSRLRPKCKPKCKKVVKKKCPKKKCPKKKKKCSKKKPAKRRRCYHRGVPGFIFPMSVPPNVQVPSDVYSLLNSAGLLDTVSSSIDSLVNILRSSYLDNTQILQLLDRFIGNDATLGYDITFKVTNPEDILEVWKLTLEEAERLTKANRGMTITSTSNIGDFSGDGIANIIADVCLARFIKDELNNQAPGIDAVEFGKEDSGTVKKILTKKIIGSKDIDVIEVIHVLSIF